MEHEFKIVLKMEDGKPLASHKVTIYLDDEPVGMVQDIKFHAAAGESLPSLDITFPNLRSDKIADSYYKTANMAKDTDRWIDKLKNLPGIRVFLKEIF